MTYCPDMSRVFYNALNSKKNRDHLTKELENMTIMDSNMAETNKDDPSKKFVLKVLKNVNIGLKVSKKKIKIIRKMI